MFVPHPVVRSSVFAIWQLGSLEKLAADAFFSDFQRKGMVVLWVWFPGEGRARYPDVRHQVFDRQWVLVQGLVGEQLVFPDMELSFGCDYNNRFRIGNL